MYDPTKLAAEVTRGDTALWFEECSKIKRKDGSLVRPKLNEHQRKICEVVQWCEDNKRPCRIVGLKPRQKGSSTISVAAGYDFLATKPGRNGLLAGGAHFQTDNMAEILRTYAENDDAGTVCRVGGEKAIFANGSKMQRITLANKNAGRSGTYQYLMITEVAYLAEEGVANATQVLNGLLKCVALEPGTIIIQESTAKGAQGDFYDTYQKGITFEQLKEGLNGYVKIFTPWYAFDDSRLDPATENIHSVDDLDERELYDMEKWGLDLEQVAWMRWAIRDECKDDYDRFIQDYPFDEDSCFLLSGSCRFNQRALDWQKNEIDIHITPETRKTGHINYRESDQSTTFQEDDESSSTVVIYEKPKEGCRYVLSVDSSEGDSQTSGKDPDSHAIFVLREGYIDAANHEWYPPAVVARNVCTFDGTVRFGCWWDVDVMERVVYYLSAHYGFCLIAPEMNCDRGLVELLKMRPRANIYRRTEFNKRESKLTEHLGWKTTPNTRNTIVESLATAIRGSGEYGKGFLLRDAWALKQFRNFIVRPNGRAEAAKGHHDDDVISIAIGNYLLPHGTVYRRQILRERQLPSDLQPFGADRFQSYQNT